jgi:glutathione synthase/RimK-type ligase-like ATP-grasp enzyme
MNDHYSLGVAWDWEFDREFVTLLEQAVLAQGKTFLSISQETAAESLHRLRAANMRVSSFLDRASDTDERFQPITHAILKQGVRIINPHDRMRHAADKATMHLEVLSHGIEVPYTLIISPYSRKTEVELSLTDLAKLGRPFIIKPANTTGGGTGVIMGAETLKDVIESRQHHKNDKYLLQEKIIPAQFARRPAWFRVFMVFGKVLSCWWNPETHHYAAVSDHEAESYGLGSLARMTHAIARVCKLDFFSTEIAVTPEHRSVVVDYVNEICDMRLQSIHPDGVPDSVVIKICEIIASNLQGLS